MRLFSTVKLVFAIPLLIVFPLTSLAAQKPTTAATPAKAQSIKEKPTKVDGAASEDGYVAASSTHIDFSETTIDGKMKAPEGFMLQGHQGSSLSQMVKLRSNFRNQLNNSRSATKALVK
jgi:hypothetical protein